MRLFSALLWSIPLAALTVVPAREAAACGGCFVQQSENTQVTSHRMIVSISKTQTTLWDQIKYDGDPLSFGWVLPTKGLVDVGTSSDALFGNLSDLTKVSVLAPTCFCGGGVGPGASSSGNTATSTGSGGVMILAQEVVGPYETVQLAAADPLALKDWLAMHQYVIPADIGPVLDAYVADGFGFLAIKLKPDAGITSMTPVRVTSPGAGVALPLRMVAAGVGPTTPITLWVLGEGRYEPTNFPSFTIPQSLIVWDWDSQSSNYKQLRQTGLQANMGNRWLVEAAEPLSKFLLSTALTTLAQVDPLQSGYADSMGMGAPAACAADLDALFAGIDPASLWVTRLYAELPHAALSTDLTLGASPVQSIVNRTLVAQTTIGTPPCDGCGASSSAGPGSGGSGMGGGSGNGGSNGNGNGGGGNGGFANWGAPHEPSCAMGGRTAPAALAGLLLALGLGAARRRRR